MKKEVSAVIVARAGSIRVPNKALREINGESLIVRKIKQLKLVPSIDRIIVGSDSDDILDVASAYSVETVKRPDLYCDERISSANDMIGNMCSLIDTDVVVWAHSTNPFLSPDSYEEAINQYFRKIQQGYDSLLSVAAFQEHLWDDKFNTVNYDPYLEKHTLGKDLPKFYVQDGGIFIQDHKQMLDNSYFFGNKPFLYEIPECEYFDINTLQDLKVANALDAPDLNLKLK
jgi:CMP-N,N'-diacetyllegionaminic acid synthase